MSGGGGNAAERREFLTLLAAGTLAFIAGCSNEKPPVAGIAVRQPSDPVAIPTTTAMPELTTTTTTTPKPRAIPSARPGRPRDISSGSPSNKTFALTIDDGFDPVVVAGYVEFAHRTGIHLTFSPNGAYRDIWDRHAAKLRPLIDAGQVQIANHTWSHPKIVSLGDTKIKDELERNETWIQSTFGITARPWFRPPYGEHSSRTDNVAGELGYTNILMWNGSFGDSTLISADQLMANATKWVQAGSIVLGHANHPTVLGLFDRIQALVAERGLRSVTLDELFGTSRATG